MQIFFVPALWCTCALFGAIASNCTFVIYGEVLWQPFDIVRSSLPFRVPER